VADNSRLQLSDKSTFTTFRRLGVGGWRLPFGAKANDFRSVNSSPQLVPALTPGTGRPYYPWAGFARPLCVGPPLTLGAWRSRRELRTT
jgi:hypothetical protein